MTGVTERQVQLMLWKKLQGCMRWVVPNFTPDDWFECDVWAVNRAGVAWEFEIKTSRGDFRKDAAKMPGSLFNASRGLMRSNMLPKYERLASGDCKGPAHFVYVAPKGVIPRDEVPAWAGLWEFEDKWSGFDRVLKSSTLHRIPVMELELERSARAVMYRLWNFYDQS